MKVILKIARPRNDKERLFRIETSANDLENPAKTTIAIGDREYLLEIHLDSLNN